MSFFLKNVNCLIEEEVKDKKKIVQWYVPDSGSNLDMNKLKKIKSWRKKDYLLPLTKMLSDKCSIITVK